MDVNPYKAPPAPRLRVVARRTIFGWIAATVCGGLLFGSIAPAVGLEAKWWKIDPGDFAIGGFLGMAVYWWATRRKVLQ
jgi:hypothetical protein